MPVHVSRKRNGIWYARGTVKVGKKAVIIPEFSTGCRARADAEAVAEAENQRIREDLIEGAAGRARRLTIADCLLAYLDRPGGVASYDLDRINDFNERIGARPLAELPEAWADWLSARGKGLSAGSVARWRGILAAAAAHGARVHNALAPRVPTIAGDDDGRVVYLLEHEADALIAGYNAHARPVATVLRYQGLRTQEALRLDWRHVDFRRRTLFVTGTAELGRPRTKTRRARTMPMHRRVRVTLYLLWRGRGRPLEGPVFLSARGEPYRDTRGHDGSVQGGNPLKRAHATACAKAKIQGFRVHDWRHHWAAMMVMSGTDLFTLMKLGGWRSLRSVLRYAAVSIDHMAEAMARVR